MQHRSIYLISGNKGGVGKSLFCLALASAFDMLGQKYAILDGDGRTADVHQAFDRKCPARLGDFRNLRPELHTCTLDEDYKKTLEQLLKPSPNLIINTPDGADATLMKWFDTTLQHTEQNNWQFKFIYLMSDRPDGLELLPELAARFHFLYPVRNLYFGSEVLFAEFNNHYLPKFNAVIDFPKLRGEEVRMLFDVKTRPFEAITLRRPGTETYALPTLTRARLMAWQKSVNENLIDMIANVDESNLMDEPW